MKLIDKLKKKFSDMSVSEMAQMISETCNCMERCDACPLVKICPYDTSSPRPLDEWLESEVEE